MKRKKSGEIVISQESDEVLSVFAAVALGAPNTASGREAYKAALLNLRLRIRELEGAAGATKK